MAHAEHSDSHWVTISTVDLVVYERMYASRHSIFDVVSMQPSIAKCTAYIRMCFPAAVICLH